jgi:RNA polymerase sigma-70 factor (ECF subfamily)
MAAARPSGKKRATSVRQDKTFERLAEPYRREIKLHCYRMLGSLHEAEDLVQETYLRAWRSFRSFDPGSSFRAWLYKIATNACLNALASRKRLQRWLPDHRAPSTTQMPDGKPAADVAWLEPYPDAELAGVADEAPNPEARYAADESVQLAFVATIQYLPPRQRAVLLLCDVLGWAATEAATLLGGSTASINSALQRARDTLAKRYSARGSSLDSEPDSAQKELLGRYLKAWEGLDLNNLVTLLKEDATYTMPPLPQWYAGREAIRAFFEWAFKLYADFRLLPIKANRQPAFAAYSRARAGAPWTAHSIQVLTLDVGSISRLTLFAKPDSLRLFEAFGLPLTLEDAAGGHAPQASAQHGKALK